MGTDKSDTTGVGGRDLPEDEADQETYTPGGSAEPDPSPESPGGTAGVHHPPAKPDRRDS